MTEDKDPLKEVLEARDALLNDPPNAQTITEAINALTAAAEWLQDYESNFDLRWKSDRRAISRWRDANPGNDCVWPDHTDLSLWLMDRLTNSEAHIAQANKLFAHLQHTGHYPSCCRKDFEDHVKRWIDELPKALGHRKV